MAKLLLLSPPQADKPATIAREAQVIVPWANLEIGSPIPVRVASILFNRARYQ
jgi:hypothetical protein